MARSLNKVMLIGNVGSDPEIRAVGSGSRVAQFSLATGYRKKDGTDVTQWHRVVAWDKPFNLVDIIEKYVKKGERVFIEGEIEYRTYDDKDGNTRYVTEIRARELMLLGGKGEGGGGDFDRGSRGGASTGAKKPASSGGYDDFQAGGLDDDDDLPF
jgi:single-strand DNA-binding protein